MYSGRAIILVFLMKENKSQFLLRFNLCGFDVEISRWVTSLTENKIDSISKLFFFPFFNGEQDPTNRGQASHGKDDILVAREQSIKVRRPHCSYSVEEVNVFEGLIPKVDKMVTKLPISYLSSA
ncbi:hypothetical protein AVEN_236893-1 [Araneus ventricosus]|uniref:Uncharacterized protein n=1 Tax=Araneus ventricosus TaxID=182803 RepID=A0A4Y2DTM4_ARAVE|nr:hypothetical protein AVEN_236893-1 [Araneus ventricosus]